MRLIIIGAGVAGLAAAHEARRAAAEFGVPLDITVLEAEARLGGKVWTRTVDGVPLDLGPDSFVTTKPGARELAEELGLTAELVTPGPQAARAYLWLRGRLRRLPPGLALGVPTGPLALLGALRQGIVGPLGALRAACEPLLPARAPAAGPPDPTVARVVRRRLGHQVADRLVAPLVLGIYGAPPEHLSMAAALPQLAGSRSLVLAMLRRPPTDGPTLLSLRGGMGRLIRALADSMAEEDLRVACPARALRFQGQGFVVDTPRGEQSADAVLLATPAPQASDLLAEVAPEAASALRGIAYSSSAVILLRYDPSDLGRPLDASGYLVAPEEGRVVTACSWLSAKWPHLAGAGVWLRAIVTSPRALAADDEPLKRRVVAEVGEAMEASRPPADVQLVRWAPSLPVYAAGHLARVTAAERALPPRLALAGAAYGGLGVPDCIRDGQEAARRLVEPLAAL